MQTIQFEVDDATAEAYGKASPEQQVRARIMFRMGLTSTPEDDGRSIADVAEEVGGIAQANGLTEEMVEDILRG